MQEVTDLTGRLLLASPQIDEGIFFRSVILVLHHDEQGAQGVVLNHRLDADVDSVLPGWGSVLPGAERLFQGGPVQVDSALGIVALGNGESLPAGVRRILPGLGLVDLDADPNGLAGQVLALRVFAGYAGWTAGQLEGEVAGGSWYVVEREGGDVFGGESASLWRAVLARQRGALALVASYPRDPGLN